MVFLLLMVPLLDANNLHNLPLLIKDSRLNGKSIFCQTSCKFLYPNLAVKYVGVDTPGVVWFSVVSPSTHRNVGLPSISSDSPDISVSLTDDVK